MLQIERNAMQYPTGPYLVAVSFFAGLCCEGFLWLLVYRTSNYQNLVETIKVTSKKVETLKGASAAKTNSKNKKLGKHESFLKATSRDLGSAKMKSNLVVTVTLLVLYRVLSNNYDGVVVAKLPFEPFGPIKPMSRRGMAGDDITECGMTFIYVMCSICLRVNLQKALGFSPPRQLNQLQNTMFAPMVQQ